MEGDTSIDRFYREIFGQVGFPNIVIDKLMDPNRLNGWDCVEIYVSMLIENEKEVTQDEL